MPIRIYGASDDLLEIDGDVQEELACFDKEAVVTIQDGNQPRAPGVRVIGQYAPGKVGAAVWRLGVEPIDEDIPIPWPVSIGMKDGYSPIVTVECSANVIVRYGDGLHDE